MILLIWPQNIYMNLTFKYDRTFKSFAVLFINFKFLLANNQICIESWTLHMILFTRDNTNEVEVNNKLCKVKMNWTRWLFLIPSFANNWNDWNVFQYVKCWFNAKSYIKNRQDFVDHISQNLFWLDYTWLDWLDLRIVHHTTPWRTWSWSLYGLTER